MIAPSRSNRHPTSREPIVASSRTSALRATSPVTAPFIESNCDGYVNRSHQ